MKKIAVLIALLFTFCVGSFAGTLSFTLESGPYNSPPEPRLKYPVSETVFLSNQQPLEFSWWNDCADTGGFILKIYKGYNMYADDLILSNKLSSTAESCPVKADLFEDGAIYTWSLARVSFAGYKSDRSFNSFKVIKKGG